MTLAAEIESRLRKTADLLKSSTNSDQKKLAIAGLALLAVTDQVGQSRASKLIQKYDELVKWTSLEKRLQD